MKRRTALIAAAFSLALAAPASAHFILHAPDSWLVENALGDPQKVAPCGGDSPSAIAGGAAPVAQPTGKVTAMKGGSLLHIKVQETVYHPGFYRVALAVLDRKELPADPVAITKDSPRGPISVSGAIQSNPQMPVLADGLFLHHARPEKGTFFETDVKLPNINCESCTVQIIQFMEDHGLNKDGEFTYHHCAALKITADPSLPLDTAWPGQS
jgi:hypothetical protein